MELTAENLIHVIQNILGFEDAQFTEEIVLSKYADRSDIESIRIFRAKI